MPGTSATTALPPCDTSSAAASSISCCHGLALLGLFWPRRAFVVSRESSSRTSALGSIRHRCCHGFQAVQAGASLGACFLLGGGKSAPVVVHDGSKADTHRRR